MPRQYRNFVKVVLAVVGSTQFAKDPDGVNWASDIIRERFRILRPHLVVSGGARGIDSLAVRLAESHGIAVQEFLPEHKRWAPHGYMERNLLIAETCSHLVCIRHYLTRTYGSGWTADRAEEMGKDVERIMWDPEGLNVPWNPPPRAA